MEKQYTIKVSDLRDINAISFEEGQAFLKNGAPIYETEDRLNFDKDLKALFKSMFDHSIPFDNNFEKMAAFNNKYNIIKR